MEARIKTKRMGGSIGIIIPRDIVVAERLGEDDTVKVEIEKVVDLSLMWGRGKDIKKSTDEIMKEIDEGELDD